MPRRAAATREDRRPVWRVRHRRREAPTAAAPRRPARRRRPRLAERVAVLAEVEQVAAEIPTDRMPSNLHRRRRVVPVVRPEEREEPRSNTRDRRRSSNNNSSRPEWWSPAWRHCRRKSSPRTRRPAATTSRDPAARRPTNSNSSNRRRPRAEREELQGAEHPIRRDRARGRDSRRHRTERRRQCRLISTSRQCREHPKAHTADHRHRRRTGRHHQAAPTPATPITSHRRPPATPSTRPRRATRATGRPEPRCRRPGHRRGLRPRAPTATTASSRRNEAGSSSTRRTIRSAGVWRGSVGCRIGCGASRD